MGKFAKAMGLVELDEPTGPISRVIGSEDKVPVPSSAIQVWLDGNNLMLSCPGEGRATVLRIDLERCSIEQSGFGKPLARQTGWVVVLNLLKDRARALAADVAPKFGSRANPIQYEIEEMMRHLTKFDEKGKEVVVVTAEELGI